MISAVAAQKEVLKHDAITFTQSLSLLKNLTRAIVSNVAFLRGLVPQDGFKKVKVDSLNIHMLDSCKNELGDRIIQWLDEGAFIALEKGYLDEMHFEIRDCKGLLLELYRLDFAMGEAAPRDSTSIVRTGSHTQVYMPSRSKPMTKGKMKAEMIHALRSLLVLSSTIHDLPDEDGITVGMRLYYNSSCPDNWEPPKFVRAQHEAKGMEGDDDNFSMQLGTVITPSHRVTVSLDITESLMKDEEVLQHEQEELQEEEAARTRMEQITLNCSAPPQEPSQTVPIASKEKAVVANVAAPAPTTAFFPKRTMKTRGAKALSPPPNLNRRTTRNGKQGRTSVVTNHFRPKLMAKK